MPKQTILIIEDEQAIIDVLTYNLTEEGFEIITATDGQKGLQLAQSALPDLVILDMMMPRKSGFVLIEALKPEPRPGEKPFMIMITANEGKRHEAYARHLGVDEYVSKPFATEKLIEVASRLFEREYRDPDRT